MWVSDTSCSEDNQELGGEEETSPTPARTWQDPAPHTWGPARAFLVLPGLSLLCSHRQGSGLGHDRFGNKQEQVRLTDRRAAGWETQEHALHSLRQGQGSRSAGQRLGRWHCVQEMTALCSSSADMENVLLPLARHGGSLQHLYKKYIKCYCHGGHMLYNSS